MKIPQKAAFSRFLVFIYVRVFSEPGRGNTNQNS